MELNEFQGLALRTESQLQGGIQLNRSNLVTLLKIVVEVTEILDGIKKATFYNKTAKLEGDFGGRLASLAKLIGLLEWQNSGRGPVGTMMDKDETIANVDPRVFHGIIGIITESGELASALLQAVEDPNHTVDAVNIQEEMSDIAWYKAILHDVLGLDWNQGLENVINKLRVRYPDKYSDEHAANRDLFAERVELERGVNLADMNRAEAGVVYDFNHGGPDQNRFFGGLASERAILDKYNSVPTATPGAASSEECINGRYDSTQVISEGDAVGIDLDDPKRRIFYVNIPRDISPEDLEVILQSVRSRVSFVDRPGQDK